jgi:hypothetical protein
MKTPIIAMVFAGALAMSMSAGTALADHDHNLITPGTTVVDIADGQTEKCPTDPGGHKFHTNAHKGRPGDFAFAQPNNPVSIILPADESHC